MMKVMFYRNKRNHHKMLEVHNDGYRHNSVKPFMWFENGVVNLLGDKCFHRWKKRDLNSLLEDYEEVEWKRKDLPLWKGWKVTTDTGHTKFFSCPSDVFDMFGWDENDPVTKEAMELVYREMLCFHRMELPTTGDGVWKLEVIPFCEYELKRMSESKWIREWRVK